MPICKKCGKDFPNRIKINGVYKVLGNRKYCLECSPYGLHNTKKLDVLCKPYEYRCKCGENNKNNFYDNKRKICKKCWNELTTEKQRNNKLKGNIYLGDKCSKCGYDKYSGALQWHHINPEKKDKSFGRKLSWSWDRLKKELDNCIILCANCHSEEHQDNKMPQ